jgi:hypothetical protein
VVCASTLPAIYRVPSPGGAKIDWVASCGVMAGRSATATGAVAFGQRQNYTQICVNRRQLTASDVQPGDTAVLATEGGWDDAIRVIMRRLGQINLG